MILFRADDGSVSLVGDWPEQQVFSPALLGQADPELMEIVITFRLRTGTARYRVTNWVQAGQMPGWLLARRIYDAPTT